ncbi:hypothetical protein ACTG9Q_00705 [Actinokineospora sp. 24-640]
MTDHLKVYAGPSIEDGYPLRYYPVDDGKVVFVLGGGGRADDVEVIYSRQSLEVFVGLANAALAEPADSK